MAFRAHKALGGPVEYLPTSGALFAVPGMTRAPVKSAQFVQNLENILSFNQNVIVVWQHTPRNCADCMLLEYPQEVTRKGLHPVRGEPNMRRVFVTGGRNQEMQMAVIGSMRGGMPWPMVVF